MRILLISNSARGHAIAEALLRSNPQPELICATTNCDPFLKKVSKEHVQMDIMHFPAILELARRTKPDFAFIAPDDPIGGGLVDRLASIGVPSIAPRKNLARIESSKSFTRHLLKQYNIPGNPKFRVFEFTSSDKLKELEASILSYIERDLQGHYVVKYDGLKGGKGVKVSGEHLPTSASGVHYAMECIAQCGSAVIEEKIIGVEFSLMSFVSGTVTVDMPAIQDHKRAFAGDSGPNTGGMGTYTAADHSLPFLSADDIKKASELNKQIAVALAKECGEVYHGILYGGFMATADGIRLIEYNARFGDPEALNILPLLKSDFVAICQAILAGTLTKEMVEFEHKATVCKYITPRSYPEGKKEVGKEFFVPTDLPSNVHCYYGDITMNEKGKLLLGSSRAVGVVGIGDTLEEAESAAQSICAQATGPVRFRADIGATETVQKRIDLVNKIRSGNY